MNIDSWKPAATIQALQQRADLYQQIRAFFLEQSVLEVETPVLSGAANTDPNIESLSISCKKKFLQTSPEFAMKRLLAAGSGSIFQICKAFRQGESGRRHNSEFTMLEWYRVGFDHFQLMDDLSSLMMKTLGERPVEKLTYRAAFENVLRVDPHLATATELSHLAKDKTGYSDDSGYTDKDILLDLLMSHVVEPDLGKGRLTFIYNYPASQCALAKIITDEEGVSVAERFEMYAEGVELANGYHELTDVVEQEQRFAEDFKKRQQLGLQQLPQDHHLIQAMAQGLPACAGVALGLDRLLMLKTGASNISEVLAFPDNIA